MDWEGVQLTCGWWWWLLVRYRQQRKKGSGEGSAEEHVNWIAGSGEGGGWDVW